MPQMGVSVSEGTVVEWRKALGEHVDLDEIICSISTDKIDTDVESPGEGTLVEILVEPGTTVDVGTVMARIEGAAGSGEAAAAMGDTPAPSVSEPAPVVREAVGNGGRPRRYSPVVQRIAAEHNIDLDRVEGTGRGGRGRKQDGLALVESGEGPAAAHRVAVPARADARARRRDRRSVSHAPPDRRAHEALAGDRGDV